MRPLCVALLLLPAAAVAAPALPSFLSTAALRGSTPKGGRPLPAPRADGTYPHERATFSFTGLTPTGFVDYSYDATTLNTTVRLGDYSLLLEAAAATCGALGDGGLRLALALPALPAGSSLHEQARHLLHRLRVGHTVVFDADALASHAAYAPGSTCGDAIDAAAPYYEVRGLQVEEGQGQGQAGLCLTASLFSAPVDALFMGVQMSLEWDPDVPRAHARRRRLGLPLEGAQQAPPGAAAAAEAAVTPLEAQQAARELLTFTIAERAFTLNFDPVKGGAAVNPIQLIPGTSELECRDCFFRLAVGVQISMSMCFRAPEVFGAAEYSYQLASDGISDSYTSCASGQLSDPVADAVGSPLPGCTTSLLPDAPLGSFSMHVAGIPVSVFLYFGMDLGLLVPERLPGRMRVGAAGSGEVRAGVKLSRPSLTSSVIPTPLFSLTYENTSTPFALDSFTEALGALDAQLVPRLTVSFWDVIPVLSVQPSYRFLLAVGESETGGGRGQGAIGPAAQSLRRQSSVLRLDSADLVPGSSTNGASIQLDTAGSVNFVPANVVVRLFGSSVAFQNTQYGGDFAVDDDTLVASFPGSAFVGWFAGGGIYRVWLFDTVRETYSTQGFLTDFPAPFLRVASSRTTFPLTGGSTTLTLDAGGTVLPTTLTVQVVGAASGAVFQSDPASWPAAQFQGSLPFFVDDLTSCGSAFGCTGSYLIRVCGADSLTSAQRCSTASITVTSSAPSAPSAPSASAQPTGTPPPPAAARARALYAPPPGLCPTGLAYSLARSAAMAANVETVTYDAVVGAFARSLVGAFGGGNLITGFPLVTPFSVLAQADIGGGCVFPATPSATPSPGQTPTATVTPGLTPSASPAAPPPPGGGGAAAAAAAAPSVPVAAIAGGVGGGLLVLGLLGAALWVWRCRGGGSAGKGALPKPLPYFPADAAFVAPRAAARGAPLPYPGVENPAFEQARGAEWPRPLPGSVLAPAPYPPLPGGSSAQHAAATGGNPIYRSAAAP